MKIIAIGNFGHEGRNVQRGELIDLDPASFGGTYDDFKAAGLIEEVSDVHYAQIEPLREADRIAALRKLVDEDQEVAAAAPQPMAAPVAAAVPTLAATVPAPGVAPATPPAAPQSLAATTPEASGANGQA